MPYLYRAPGPQEPPAPKDARITHSSGQSFEELRQTCLQKGVLLEDADFPANSSSLFYSERPQLPFVWKRRGDGGFRLNGSYEALKRGSAIEAIEDFTAGVAETFTTKEAPGNFSEILDKALKRGCLVGCSIDIRNAAEPEARTPFGLIRGHAYTVTGVDQVNFRGQNTELVRVRNPWGQVEWTGFWSDSSSEWRSVGPAEQKRLCRTALDDREFWYRACLCFPFRINSITETDIKFEKLSLTSCKNIISLMDTSGNGKLGFGEFRVFWDKLKKWTNLFLQFDADKSGTVSPYELRTALKATGFQLSSPLLQLIVLRYADQERQLGFDDFLNCLVRLETASRMFQALGTKNKEFIHLSINEGLITAKMMEGRERVSSGGLDEGSQEWIALPRCPECGLWASGTAITSGSL
ncbi:calpain-9 [Globicephala melas]|uniref:calpain-9 n=1 Tax=Globicephala melas TaxID=9731 RepID=UPI00293D8234|nr:calpain-9 [Globicephala melas]